MAISIGVVVVTIAELSTLDDMELVMDPHADGACTGGAVTDGEGRIACCLLVVSELKSASADAGKRDSNTLKVLWKQRR